MISLRSNSMERETAKELSGIEINQAVADKLGYGVSVSGKGQALSKDGVSIVVLKNATGNTEHFDPCNIPNDYMPIAIEHHIEISPYYDDVYCTLWSAEGMIIGVRKKYYPKEQTGRAVCEAYLKIGVKNV